MKETVLMLSKLHVYDWEWHPEEGSAARERELETLRLSQVRVFHWRGSQGCPAAKWNRRDTHACLDGYEFDSIPEINRCPTCVQEFALA
jgi:hypothetical protein